MALFRMPNFGPHAPAQRQDGSIQVASSFGLDNTTLGPQFPAMSIIGSQRALELDYRSKFFECKQHDWKIHDWNGGIRRVTRYPTQPLIGNNLPDFYVPLNQRRPQAPYRLARTIVGAFTTLIFGHGRWPTLLSDDPETQDFADALVKAIKLKTKMIRARNLGGASGTTGLSWGFNNGNPRVRVHAAKHLYVHEWEDEDEFIPAHVIELYQYPKDVWNEQKKMHERLFFWHRRDWTKNADIEFVPVQVTKDNPTWNIDQELSVLHKDDNCHFVWIQNLPDDDTTSIDGQADYAELFEQLDTIDLLNSVNVKGVIANLDPTLKLKMDQEDVGGAVVKKGSENAIITGRAGDANYMELSGSAVTAGHAAIDKQREQVLETCQCVVPDPNEVVGSATSSVALKIVYAPMLSKGDIMRDQYGDAIQRLLTGMIEAARKLNIGGVVTEITVDDEGNQVTDEDSERDVQYELNLPPKQEKVEVLDELGNPTGEYNVATKPRVPGKGQITLEWPDYFKETADDRQKQQTALSGATAGKAILSQQSAVEILATSMQRNPQDEWARIRKEQEESRAAEGSMFPPGGGAVPDENTLPPGAESDEEPTNGNDEAPPPEDGSADSSEG